MTNIMSQGRQASLVRYSRFSPRPSFWAQAGQAFGGVVTALLDWQSRARQRRLLLSLSDAALKDFGRSRADAAYEGDKPAWRG